MFDENCLEYVEYTETIALGCIPVVQVNFSAASSLSSFPLYLACPFRDRWTGYRNLPRVWHSNGNSATDATIGTQQLKPCTSSYSISSITIALHLRLRYPLITVTLSSPSVPSGVPFSKAVQKLTGYLSNRNALSQIRKCL